MMYYIIITPLLTVAMTKLVYSGEQEMTLVDAASDEEVLEALRRAQCMDIINKLPKGINTVIGEKGTYLSGGERQRISIARAFLKDGRVLENASPKGLLSRKDSMFAHMREVQLQTSNWKMV